METKKIRVSGLATVRVSVVIEVELDEDGEFDEEEAFDQATREFGGIRSYCGNFGTDKLVGVDGHNESCEVDSDPEFNEWEEE